MRKIFKSFLLLTALLAILTCLPSLANAQSDPGCDPLCNCRNSNPLDICPIDSNLYILLAIGVGYGIKRISSNRKRQISTPRI